jgi:hypothetical protein
MLVVNEHKNHLQGYDTKQEGIMDSFRLAIDMESKCNVKETS